MVNHEVSIKYPDTPVSRFDIIIEGLMIGLLVFLPSALGAVEAWSEMVVIILTGAMAICWVLKLLVTKNAATVWTWSYVPVGLFVLLVVFQLWPLPELAAGLISSNTVATKASLLGDLPNAPEILSNITLSFYPLATVHDLRLVLSVALIFIITVNVYRRSEQIKRLLFAIVVIGSGMALLALAQYLFDNGKIYWVIPSGDKQAHCGTFVNHSHYSQFMNLSIGAALGLLLFKLYEMFQNKKITLPEVIARLGDPALRLVWYCTAMIIIGATTIFVSLSRGGVISLLIAGAFTTVALAFRSKITGRSWVIILMAVASFICAIYIGFDGVYERLATLRDFDEAQSGRWQIIKDISLAWTRFPLVGTGLGTHDVVYPMFDRSTTPYLAGHAENEYAQAAEETGVLGLGLIVIFAVIIWRSYFKNLRVVGLPIRSASFGLGLGLLAVMIHSLSDFGQHLPANACLTAIFCGLIITMGKMPEVSGASANGTDPAALLSSGKPGRNFQNRHIVALVCVTAVWIWAFVGAKNAYVAESHWNQVVRMENALREKDWLGSNEEYAEILWHTMLAVKYQPDNVKYRHWLNVYRWRSISRVSDLEAGQVTVTPEILKYTEQIVDDLHQTRVLCPTYGVTYCITGQLEKYVLCSSSGGQFIRTGFRLAPCDVTTCFVAGKMDAQEGDIQGSLEKFRRAIDLDSSFFPAIVDVYVYQIKRPDVAVLIAQDNIYSLSYVARVLSENDEQDELVIQTRSEVSQLLESKCSQLDAPAYALVSLAGLYRKEENYPAAADYYKRALLIDYGQVDWRLARAEILAKMGKITEASQEVQNCLRQNPQMAAARKLMKKLDSLTDMTDSR